MRHAARTPIVARTGTLLVAAVLSLSACAATPPVEAPARPRPSAPTVTPAAPERFTSSVGAFVPTLPAAPVARIDWQSTGVMAASRLGVLYVEHPEYPRPDGVCPLVGGSADRCALFSFAPYATPGTSPEDWLRVPARAISAWSVPKRASSDWVSLHSGRDFVYGVRRDGTLEAIDDRGQSTPLVSGEKLPFRWELLRPTSVDVFETATSTVVVGRERAGKQSLFVLSLAIDHATVRVTSERFSRLPMTAWAIDDRAEDPGPGKRLFTAWTADLLLDASGAARPEWALVWWEKLAGEKEVAWVTVVGDNGGVLRESKLAVRRGPIRTRPARGGLVVEGTPVDDRGRKRGPAAKDPDSVPVPAFAREGVQLESLVTTGFDRASAQGIVVAYQNALVARAFGADGAPSGDLTRVTDSPISPEEAVRVGDDWVATSSRARCSSDTFLFE